MTPRDIVLICAQLVMLMSFVVLSAVALWPPWHEPSAIRWIAGLGVASLLVRALALLWPHCVVWVGGKCVRREPPPGWH